MKVKHVTETADGKVVFQGILEGPELAFVIECGLDYAINNNIAPFVSTQTFNEYDIYQPPESEQ